MTHLLNLLAAIALLVWGTHLVRAGVLQVFGANLRALLGRSTGNRFTAALSGLGVTALVQSSTATALITSSFVGQGLIALPAALAVMLGADVGVDSVQYDAAWRARLDAWLAFASRALGLLALILAAGAVLVVGNTVRLDLNQRREEIALLQQLGADDADIRRPLLHFGALLGVLSGVLALCGVFAVGALLRAPMAELVATYAGGFALVGPGPVEAGAILATAASLGWLGARVAAGHYLRTSPPAAS